MDETLLRLVDYVAPNESELAGMARDENGVRPSLKTDEDIIAAARIVTGKLKTKVLCTLGARGAVLIAGPSVEDVTRVEVAPLPPGAEEVDATAAGDAFRAAFAVGLSEGKSESEAMRFAAAAGALTVTKLGAMPSLPSREDVDKLLGVSESRCVKSVEKSSAAAAKEREIAAVRFASRLNSMKSRMDLFPDARKRSPRCSISSSAWVAREEYLPSFEFSGTLSKHENWRRDLRARFTRRRPGAELDLGRGVRPISEGRAGWARSPIPIEPCGSEPSSWSATPVARRRRSTRTKSSSGLDTTVTTTICRLTTKTPRNDMVQSYKTVTSSDECARLKVSVEFKPTDEKSRFSFIPTTAAAILLADAVGEPNFGLTLDFGHPSSPPAKTPRTPSP